MQAACRFDYRIHSVWDWFLSMELSHIVYGITPDLTTQKLTQDIVVENYLCFLSSSRKLNLLSRHVMLSAFPILGTVCVMYVKRSIFQTQRNFDFYFFEYKNSSNRRQILRHIREGEDLKSFDLWHSYCFSDSKFASNQLILLSEIGKMLHIHKKGFEIKISCSVNINSQQRYCYLMDGLY